MEKIVHQWGVELLRNLGPELPTSCYNKLHAAISALEEKLLPTIEEE